MIPPDVIHDFIVHKSFMISMLFAQCIIIIIIWVRTYAMAKKPLLSIRYIERLCVYDYYYYYIYVYLGNLCQMCFITRFTIHVISRRPMFSSQWDAARIYHEGLRCFLRNLSLIFMFMNLMSDTSNGYENELWKKQSTLLWSFSPYLSPHDGIIIMTLRCFGSACDLWLTSHV